jgi:hypothetical protein
VRDVQKRTAEVPRIAEVTLDEKVVTQELPEVALDLAAAVFG